VFSNRKDTLMGAEEISLLAPVFVLVFVTLTVAGVILLKPISSKLAGLLEAMARERNAPAPANGARHVHELVETLEGRVSLLEERLDYAEALFGAPERKKLGPTDGTPGTAAEGAP